MAKRFTETDKWKDKWFRRLKPLEKLLWIYMIDNCDNAGFLELDYELIAFSIKAPEEDIQGACKGLARGLLFSGNKNHQKVWIIKFLEHQKNIPLIVKNNAHRQIIRILNKNILDFPEVIKYLGASEGLASPPGKGKGKGIGKYNKEGLLGEIKNIKYPTSLDKPDFQKVFENWINYKAFKNQILPPQAIDALLIELNQKLKEKSIDDIISAINKSMSSNSKNIWFDESADKFFKSDNQNLNENGLTPEEQDYFDMIDGKGKYAKRKS